MVEIVRAKTRSQVRKFFDLVNHTNYTSAEVLYIMRYYRIDPETCAYLMAFEGKIPRAILLTGQLPMNRFGLFSLPYGNRAALKLLFNEAERLHREWGSKMIVGPMGIDVGGYLFGQCDKADCSDERGDFTGGFDKGQTEVITESGYTPSIRHRAFIADVPKVNPYAKAANYFAKRLNLKCEVARRNPFNCNLFDAVREMEAEDVGGYLRQLERILPFIALKHSCVVSDAEGSYHGYAISLKGSPLRVSTIMTKNDNYRRPTALLLASALCDSFISNGVHRVELSTIDVKNSASIQLAKGIGAVADRDYIVYNKELT